MADSMEATKPQLRQVIEHFKDAPVPPTDAILEEYCAREGIPTISAGVYADWLFQYNHDERMKAFVPRLMEILARYQYPPELVSDDEAKKIREANDALEVEACNLMEEVGMLYQEVDLITHELGDTLRNVVANAGIRANNMSAAVMADLTQEKYGRPLTIKVLGDAYRAMAAKRNAK